MLFDRFKRQYNEEILSPLVNNNVRLAIVPVNCTDRLQLLDVSVNKLAKDFLQRRFQEWHSEEVRRQSTLRQAIKFDLAMSIVQPLRAQRLIELED